MNIKIFSCEGANKLREALQAWLDEHPNVEIEHVAQSEGNVRFITLTIFYRLRRGGPEQ